MHINVTFSIGIAILIVSIIFGLKQLMVKESVKETTQDIQREIEINLDDSKKTKNLKRKYDLVIIGAGLAGLTAAYEASKDSNIGINILLIEASNSWGGNYKNEIDGINLLFPNKNNKYDNFTSFFDDSFEYGRYSSEKDLLAIMLQKSPYIYNLLFDELKLNNTFFKLVQSEGSRVPRTLIYNDTKKTTAEFLTYTLYNRIKNNSSVDIVFNSRLVHLIIDDATDKVKGLKYQVEEGKKFVNYTIYSKAVILSTGGYGSDFYNDDSILKEFLFQLFYFPTVANKHTQGEGIKIIRTNGGKLIDLRESELYPTCFVDLSDRYNRYKVPAPDLFRELGGILINKRGKRFCNEMENRRYIAQNILKNCDIVTDPRIIKQYEGFLIVNEEIKEKYGEEFDDFLKKGLLRKFNSIDEFTKVMNISQYFGNIRKTINSYNNEKQFDRFGKARLDVKFKMNEKIYAGIVTPCIYHTLGGIKINEKAEIINEEKEPMLGLFAAGQIIGGIHGIMAMPGNILTQSIIFGKIASESAIKYITKNFK